MSLILFFLTAEGNAPLFELWEVKGSRRGHQRSRPTSLTLSQVSSCGDHQRGETSQALHTRWGIQTTRAYNRIDVLQSGHVMFFREGICTVAGFIHLLYFRRKGILLTGPVWLYSDLYNDAEAMFWSDVQATGWRFIESFPFVVWIILIDHIRTGLGCMQESVFVENSRCGKLWLKINCNLPCY